MASHLPRQSVLADAADESSSSAAAHIWLNVATMARSKAIANMAAAMDPATSDWRNER
ncbi:hypothetical protein PQQ52_29845 [Paraburkholderia sediminicola]|uniref:hypothetical protein n=1 Tax=Paraburkholderia sediminicola TaxID=458836 RepID=UPI0038BAABBB